MSLLHAVTQHLRRAPTSQALYLGPSPGEQNVTWQDLFTLAANQPALTAFTRYCIRESGIENLLALLAIRSYEKHPSREKLAFIQHHFITVNAPFETNISGKVRQALRSRLLVSLLPPRSTAGHQRRNALLPAPLNRNLFKEAGYTNEIGANLGDTWSRFICSLDLRQPHLAEAPDSAAVAPVRQLMTAMQLVGFALPAAVVRACP